MFLYLHLDIVFPINPKSYLIRKEEEQICQTRVNRKLSLGESLVCVSKYPKRNKRRSVVEGSMPWSARTACHLPVQSIFTRAPGLVEKMAG